MIAGVSVLDAINERFPLLNNIDLSFHILSSAKEAYERVDWTYLKVDSTMKGSDDWLNRLFH